MFRFLHRHHKNTENVSSWNTHWIGLKATEQKSVSDSEVNRVLCLWLSICSMKHSHSHTSSLNKIACKACAPYIINRS